MITGVDSSANLDWYALHLLSLLGPLLVNPNLTSFLPIFLIYTLTDTRRLQHCSPPNPEQPSLHDHSIYPRQCPSKLTFRIHLLTTSLTVIRNGPPILRNVFQDSLVQVLVGSSLECVYSYFMPIGMNQDNMSHLLDITGLLDRLCRFTRP